MEPKNVIEYFGDQNLDTESESLGSVVFKKMGCYCCEEEEDEEMQNHGSTRDGTPQHEKETTQPEAQE